VFPRKRKESHHTTLSRNVVESHHAISQGSERLDRQGLGEQVRQVVVRVDMYHFNQSRVTQAAHPLQPCINMTQAGAASIAPLTSKCLGSSIVDLQDEWRRKGDVRLEAT
jgi:hypothetical protein